MNPFLYRSEYRLNDNSDDIVYYSEAMDAIIRVTKEQFLADNPDLTEQDFVCYKAWSDSDLHNLYKHNRTEGNKHCTISEALEHREGALQDDLWIEQCETSMDLKLILTPKQYRRFMLYSIYGLTTNEIAAIEGTSQQSISFTIDKTRKRIKKYFQGGL